MNNNNRPLGWTTLEESKQLVEVGLPVETADMRYSFIGEHIKEAIENDYLLHTGSVDKNSYTFKHKFLVPCWSLGALIQMLPLNIQIGDSFLDKYGLEFKLYSEYTYKIAYCLNQSHHPMVFTEKHGTLIEACVEMVIWLLNNKFYEQEKC